MFRFTSITTETFLQLLKDQFPGIEDMTLHIVLVDVNVDMHLEWVRYCSIRSSASQELLAPSEAGLRQKMALRDMVIKSDNRLKEYLGPTGYCITGDCTKGHATSGPHKFEHVTVVVLREMLKLPPCDTFADLDEVLSSTAEELHDLCPEKISSVPFHPLKPEPKPIFRVSRGQVSHAAWPYTGCRNFTKLSVPLRTSARIPFPPRTQERDLRIFFAQKPQLKCDCKSWNSSFRFDNRAKDTNKQSKQYSEDASRLERLSQKILKKLEDINRHVICVTKSVDTAFSPLSSYCQISDIEDSPSSTITMSAVFCFPGTQHLCRLASSWAFVRSSDFRNAVAFANTIHGLNVMMRSFCQAVDRLPLLQTNSPSSLYIPPLLEGPQLVTILLSCAEDENLVQGRHAHNYIASHGFHLDFRVGNALIHISRESCLIDVFQQDLIVANALINMYGKCADVEGAVHTFEVMHLRDVISWNGMISAYARSENTRMAHQMFMQMHQEGFLSNTVTYVIVLDACGDPALLPRGKHLHASIATYIFKLNIKVENALVNMYGMCGKLEDALRTFAEMPEHNTVSFLTIVCGCIDQEAVIEGTLAGLIEEGHAYFRSMTQKYGIEPTLDHYHCMIDLLARSGRVNEAEKMLNSMRFSTVMSWMILLSACKKEADIGLAERAARRIILLDPDSTAPYVLLSNVYLVVGREDLVSAIQQEATCNEAVDNPLDQTQVRYG
ncbi:hypothetical protein GOP47_0004208 [Adiantum capillus-veneris]|uniref:Pentatricopeptide repeat-containing protein n=1 Tax=Adiantum capillus-veneris TaxID=13818 RepID=A0A9D4ZQ59_ADICA|nr:hypothetical protein GOP47_0004208 [Adiantum capillus-veneris]